MDTLLNRLFPMLHKHPHHAQEEEHTYAHLWFEVHEGLLALETDGLSADLALGTTL